MVIFLENHSYSQIIGNSCCPYLNAQAKKGLAFTNYHGITHPSLPNHIAGTSGVLGGQARHLTLAIGCGVAISLAAGGGWGAFNGYLIGYRNIPAFVVTLGSLGMALGLAQVLTGGVNVSGVPYSLQTTLGSGKAPRRGRVCFPRPPLSRARSRGSQGSSGRH